MEVESLFQHVVTPTVMKDFPTLMKRIAGADIPHGADILFQLHQRMLRQLYPGTLSLPHAPPIVGLKQWDMLGTDVKGQQGGEALSTPLVENSEDSVLKSFRFTFCEPVGGRDKVAVLTSESSEPAPTPLTPDQKKAETRRVAFLRREVARLEASKVRPPYEMCVLEMRIARTIFADPPEHLPLASKLSTIKIDSEILDELKNMIVDLLIGRRDAEPINVTASCPSSFKHRNKALKEFVTENQFSMRSLGSTFVITFGVIETVRDTIPPTTIPSFSSNVLDAVPW